MSEQPSRHDSLTPHHLEERADRRPPARDGEGAQQARDFSIEAARLMRDLHCEHILIYDVRGMSEITDFIIVASGTSDRQIKAVAGQVTDLGKTMGMDRFGTDRDEAATWLVLDFVEVMVHLFEPATRAHYDLEMMWGDAPQVDWQR
ncbi:MAG: ribosome silencing factor [Phycisphaeraceae bacterium]